MGLGVFYQAPVPRRGWLKRATPVPELWEEVSKVSREAVKRVGWPLTEWFWSHAEEARLWISIVPFEENVELQVRGETVEVSAKTSSAGPGYHELVVSLLDLLERELGLAWRGPDEKDEETDDDTDGDETGFRKNRDGHALRKAMTHQLTSMASVVLKEFPDGGTILNMSTDMFPVERAYASSSTGEWSEEWLQRLDEADGDQAMAMAKEFFPWWGTGIGEQEFESFGKALCWTDVRWVKPRTEADERTVRTALACFEKAKELGATDLPDLEIAELRQLLEPDTNDGIPPRARGIGYRRRVLETELSGKWTLHVPGYFHQDVENEGETLVYWFGSRTIRTSTLSFKTEKTPGETLAFITKGRAEPLDEFPTGLVGALETKWDEGDACFITRVYVVGATCACFLTFAYLDEADRAWAIQVARTAKHRG